MSTTCDSVFLCSPFDRPSWTAAPEYREGAIKSFGFTDRQARFLVAVMLHGGVCVERQYCRFAGIAHGQKAHDFFKKLVDRGHASNTTPGALHAGRFYHVHQKTLYRAIGETDNRNRKPVSYPAAIERLMLLDAVLAEPQLTWLGSTHDKLSYFTDWPSQLRTEALPHLSFGQPKVIRYFPDKLPIGVHRDGRAEVFLYLVTRSSPVDFRAFLDRHFRLWRALHRWELRVLLPRPFWSEQAAYERAFYEQLATPISLSESQELAWLFGERRRLAETGTASSDARFRTAEQRFRAPRFSWLYRSWRRSGDAAFWPALSSILADKMDRGDVRLRCDRVIGSYMHLDDLAGTA
ncbi:MAG: hypothetical protein KA745_09015 [Gemmatimonadales bacterium]|nr:hypothetical protein [Gemmatimonadales bacterium]